jgi:hypothetical protein
VSQGEKDLKVLEISKLKEQWERDLETEKLEKESVINANKQVYKDIEEFNRREELVRSKRSTIEKTVINKLKMNRKIKNLLMLLWEKNKH